MKILSSSLASANVWIMRLRAWPNWSRAALGASLTVAPLTDSRKPPYLRCSQKERSRIDQNALDLWGMAAMGEILSQMVGSSLMLSHSTSFACPAVTLATLSLAKCAMATGDNADLCGLRATASHISCFVHGRPIFCRVTKCGPFGQEHPRGVSRSNTSQAHFVEIDVGTFFVVWEDGAAGMCRPETFYGLPLLEQVTPLFIL